MATKKRKQQNKKLTQPIKASVWFENQTNLPTEVRTPTKKRKAPLSEVQKLDPPVKASVWFENQDLLPTSTETPVQVNVDVKPVPQAGNIASKQAAVDSALAEAAHKETFNNPVEKVIHDDMEGLISSILNLTNAIQQERIDRIRGEELPKDDPNKKYKSITELLKVSAKEKYSELKEKTSLRNILLMSGVKSAFKGSETILDNLLAYREAKKAEQTKPSVTGSIAMGASDYTVNKIKSLTKNVFGGVTNKITNSSVGQKVNSVVNSVAGKFSGVIDTLNDKDNVLAHPLFNLSKYARIEAIKNPNSLVGSISRRYYPEIKNDKELDISRILNKPSNKDEKEFQGGVREGMREELVKLNEDQLTQLKKIVSALSESTENKFEANDKAPTPISTPPTKVEKPEDDKSLLGSAMEKFGGLSKLLGGAKGKLIKGAAALAPLLARAAPAAGVLAAGAAGYGAGSLLDNTVISPLMEKVTGVKGETLGTAAYTAVDKFKGLFGTSDADKLAPKGPREVIGKIKDASKAKPGEAYRVVQTQQLKTTIKETELLKKASEGSKSNQSVDARTSIVNNSSTVQYIRPQVKNQDNTFNQLLSKNFNH